MTELIISAVVLAFFGAISLAILVASVNACRNVKDYSLVAVWAAGAVFMAVLWLTVEIFF